jgi:hypothetical protein
LWFSVCFAAFHPKINSWDSTYIAPEVLLRKEYDDKVCSFDYALEKEVTTFIHSGWFGLTIPSRFRQEQPVNHSFVFLVMTVGLL